MRAGEEGDKAGEDGEWGAWTKAVNSMHELKNGGERWRCGRERRNRNNGLGIVVASRTEAIKVTDGP